MNGVVGGGKGPVTAGSKGLHSDLAVCVWVPLFPLRCEEQRRPKMAQRATALLAPDDLRRLWQVGAHARRAGVKPGMTVSQAVGLCPWLTVWEPDPVYYDEQLSHLLAALSDVSPVIEPAELGRAFVGVDGLESLYGSAERQVAAIREAVGTGGAGWQGGKGKGKREKGKGESMPLSPTSSPLPPGGEEGKRGCRTAPAVGREQGWATAVRLGWARGKFAAWVAATRAKPGEACIVTDRERTRFLESQPIAVLRVDPDTHRRLSQLSIRTLRDLARLPEVAVVSQFGGEGRRLWQLATGAVSDPVIGRETPQPIVSEIDFPNPVVDAAVLAQAVERLVERALRHPRRAGWRVLQAGARARQEHGVSWMTRVTLKDPSANKDRIAAPLCARLAQASLTAAVEQLAVELLTFVPGTEELQLFARDANSAARAGRRRALRAAVHEMRTRFRRSTLFHVIEVNPHSRIPERRYALIDYDA